MRLDKWTILRSLISAFFLIGTVWMAIADYPAHARISELFLEGNAYYAWQFVILFVAWHFSIWWTVYWQRRLQGFCPICGERVLVVQYTQKNKNDATK